MQVSGFTKKMATVKKATKKRATEKKRQRQNWATGKFVNEK